MKIKKDGTIICSPKHMIQILRILEKDSTARFDWLLNEPIDGPRGHEVYLFRGGAKLARRSESRWYIYGYVPGRSDERTARWELQAADHIRQALSLLESVDVCLVTPRDFRIKWKGLWGVYPQGQLVPSQLHYMVDRKKVSE